MIPFNYHHLYYFYVIVKEGSVSKAAVQLRLAQPTLSAQLKQFENFLKVKLFIRDKKKLILTEEGHRVLSYAKLIFDIGQEMKNRMVDLSEKGRLRINIGVTNYVPKTIVEFLLNFLLKSYPDVYITLTKDRMEKLAIDLQDHLVDLILTDVPYNSPAQDHFKNHLIGQIGIVFCCHPKLAKKFKRFPADLNGMPMLLPAAPRQIFYTIQEYLLEHNIKPEIIGEIEDIEIIRRLVLREYAVAPLNLLTIKEAPAKQKLTILNSAEKLNINEKIYIITKQKKMEHPLVEKILKEFKIENYLKNIK